MYKKNRNPIYKLETMCYSFIFLKEGWQRNLFEGIYFPEYFFPVKKKDDESHDMTCLEFVNKMK